MIEIGLRPEDYETHSPRRTKASIIYKQTGNPHAVRILLGHTKITSTVRYLGVDVEDALALVNVTNMQCSAAQSNTRLDISIGVRCPIALTRLSGS